ncbi:MAG: 4-alpha-glucanotransferase [Verrucomicrobiales bacterium]|jgi:4-alpha-glucanotransferase|nr:4-alpha-glucanotransferase [Verrucomicrobiales bacterium]
MKISTGRRCAGIFVPVFALRSEDDLGAGDTKSLTVMVAWCARAGFSVLQVLPINETSDDNSPYNAISANALDITTLHITPESVPGLTQKIYDELCPPLTVEKLRQGPVQYGAVKKLKRELCRWAFERFEKAKSKVADGQRGKFEQFIRDEKSWLADYGLFRVLMELNDGAPTWERWLPEHRSPSAARSWLATLSKREQTKLAGRERFFAFVQWLLFTQWSAVRADGDARGVALMGDIPFGVSRHSADVWARRENFDLRWSGGAPPEPFFQPDEFTKKWGQNWGMPLYDWEFMAADGHSWWRQRVRQVSRFFRIFRIDHILGFYRCYAFPWRPEENSVYTPLTVTEAKKKAGALPRFFPRDDETEESCAANREHGEALIEMLKDAAGDSIIVGEDLGVVPIYARPSLARLNVSGFKIPLFERDEESKEYLPPEEYPSLSVATLATHDHETMAGMWATWWREFARSRELAGLPDADGELVQKGVYASWELYRTQRFCRLDDRTLLSVSDYEPAVREALCRRLLESKSWLATLMVTDLFGLKIRFNVPGPVAESNWSERLPFNMEAVADDERRRRIIEFISGLIKRTGRKTER